MREDGRAAMPAWFDDLPSPEKDAWLDAWEDQGDVPAQLLDTLPADRRPGSPGQAVALWSWSWWVVAGKMSGPNYRMTDDLRAFLGERHRRLRSYRS